MICKPRMGHAINGHGTQCIKLKRTAAATRPLPATTVNKISIGSLFSILPYSSIHSNPVRYAVVPRKSAAP